MVDYDKLHAMRMADLEITGGSAEDGLTVLDYFAAKVFPVLIGLEGDYDFEMVARDAYEAAHCLMLARSKQVEAEKTMTVEEAFGLPQ